MEYVQMTLNDWLEIKQKLRQELLSVKQSFVRIGYMLRKVEEQKGYEQDGYKSIAEFAQKELGLHPSTTTRFMEINREYSIDGYSERLREEYIDLGRSQLEEMLKLPDRDRVMVQPETSRESIRELKRFNGAGPQEGADDITQMIIKFYKDNPEALNDAFSIDKDNPAYTSKFKELVNPSGNKSYKMGLYFMMMYENKISIKKFGQDPQEMTWEEYIQRTWDIFGEMAAGNKTWNRYFGGEKDGKEREPLVPENESRERAAEQVPDPEDDNGTAGEVSTDESEEEEKGGVENHGTVSETGGTEKEDDSTREESGERDCGGTPERTDEPGRKESEQKEDEPEKEPEALEPFMNEPDIVEKPFGTRKDYIDSLTAYGTAMYMADEYKNHNLKASSLAFPTELEKWLNEEVDCYGQTIEN